ncbi:Ubiquitin carboxyl-terminal hydrolase isozyme L3 [Takifugu flavidus]|uniref:Ubiquitin carboxyl-terminal hydrolase n=1 Tax=Takifugu flavidus TaxID=433684 RepID=A0A5C6PQR9_9TELE|nr:Ubiquitin carboxyl-terminal hydrolase isozyme L3 [Takifugu flavidus]
MVPRPVCAVLLLFPVTDTYEAFKQEEEDRIKQQPQDLSPDVYFIKQTISNACGTIGLLHAMGNNQKYLEFDGRKAFPIVHGKTSEDTFLEDALGVCKTFMDRDPEEVLFTIVALSKNSM